ncbi:peroxynitrite isomerase THAP4-like [Ixodes scapularis]|uniref:peroxynitrite isomerase THAP4-like n=1 Tax=Ixodes scapularis TaxID=6945 RepID=UPI001C384586|nr:peroxynitrite isomerase THAP4-like [Ixodes scapularis]
MPLARGWAVSLFAIPSDPALRKKWVVAIKRDEGKHFSITKYTKICSGHFREGDYIPNVASKRRYLRQEAVPSIFAFNVAKRPPRKKPRVRQAPPSTPKFSTADAGVTNDAIADPSSQDAVSEPASEEASYAFADLTGGHAAPEASSQKNASGEIVTVNAMEDFAADFMCHAVATEDSVVNDCNIDDCVNAATGAVLDRAESLKWATNVSLFTIPSDPALRKKWVVAIKRDEGKQFSITKYTKICSGHFREGDYIPNVASKRRYLRQEAVPSIFAFNVAKRPPRKKPRVRQAPPLTPKFSAADAAVTNDAIADPSSQDAVSEPASEEASCAFADLTGGHAAPGASSQKNASGEIVTVNAMEDFAADFMCHAVATEDSVVNDCNIDDCVNAATGAVLDRAESLKWATNVWHLAEQNL